MIGSSFSSKNSFFLVAWIKTLGGGIPLTSIIRDNYSCSLSPGNIGYPVNSSTKMHPKLHMSIPGV